MNKQIILKQRPSQIYNPSIFSIESSPMAPLQANEILVQPLYLSIDASMRIWITGVRTYIKGVDLNEVMNGFGVGVVLHSNDPSWKKGQYCTGMLGWQEYTVKKANELQTIHQTDHPLHSLGIKGISGLTAFFGLTQIGQVKSGETVLISSAAGGVGIYAVQFAKLMGCKVIGIVGSSQKQEFVKSLGADLCLNYKDNDFSKQLKNVGKIHVYFDNVGGSILDLCLLQMENYGRIISCGAISGYDNKNEVITNYPLVITKRLTIKGFIYFDYASKTEQAFKFIDENLKLGKLKTHDMVFQGLESAPEALKCLLEGKNTGKVIVSLNKNPKL